MIMAIMLILAIISDVHGNHKYNCGDNASATGNGNENNDCGNDQGGADDDDDGDMALALAATFKVMLFGMLR